MAGIQREQFFARHSIPEIEFMRTDDVAFRADPKKLGLDRIEIEFGIKRFGKNCIERSRQPFARSSAVNGRLFGTVGNPEVGDASFAKAFSDGCADFATGDGVIDPELADAFVTMGEGETVRGFGMGKECLVEIEAEPLRPTLRRSASRKSARKWGRSIVPPVTLWAWRTRRS